MLPWGGWPAGMCSLLRFFQVSFLHPWLLHDSTAAVQANVSQRPDVIFYTSGKRVWNPTKWDRWHFICSWQGSKRQCLSPAPCSWCSFLYSRHVQTAVVVASANQCLRRGKSPGWYSSTETALAGRRKALWDWPELYQILIDKGSREQALIPYLSIWGTWLNLGLLLHVQVAALARRRFHLHLLPGRCFFIPVSLHAGSAALSC